MRCVHEREIKLLKAAVIGVGSMGRHHARVYSELDQVELVAVADANRQVVDWASKRHGGRPYTDYLQMLDAEQPDLISVAVPTDLHHQVACDAMQRGIHVLIEKPLARHMEEGVHLLQLARQQGVVLTVGHIERFNPAIIELKRRLDNGAIGRAFHLNVRRWSPYPKRIRDVGVILDLATHDLDIMPYLVGERVERVYAEADFLLSSDHEDSISAFLRFPNGTLGALDVNWVTPCKVRQLSVTGECGMITVDYLSQDLYIYQNDSVTSDWERLTLFTGVSEGDMIRPSIAKREPLRVELESFVAAVVGGHPPLITGQDGLEVLRLANAVADSARTRQPVVISWSNQ